MAFDLPRACSFRDAWNPGRDRLRPFVNPFWILTFFRNISFRNTYHLSFNSQFHINTKKKHEVFGNFATISSRIPQPHQRVSVCSRHFASRWNPWKNPWKPNLFCFTYYLGVSKNARFPQQLLVFLLKLLKMIILEVFGVPPFKEKHPYNSKYFLKIKSMRLMRRSKCVDLVWVLLAVWQTRCSFAFSFRFNGLIGHQQISGLVLGFLCLP